MFVTDYRMKGDQISGPLIIGNRPLPAEALTAIKLTAARSTHSTTSMLTHPAPFMRVLPSRFKRKNELDHAAIIRGRTW